jgi:hypothetical protein
MKKKYSLLTITLILGFMTSIFGQGIPPYVPTDGLIGWWPFSGNANDESGNNNNGTINGAVLTTDRLGNANSAYSFDGSSSYISIPSSASLESPATRITMSAWVNLAGFSLIGQPFDPILMKSDNGANAFMYRFDIDINGAGFYAGINNWNNNVGTPYNFLLNQWYMVSAVLDSSAAYFYLNDSLVGAQVFTTNILNNTLPLEIGRDVPGSTEVFNGKIDEIGIWNKALTHEQISNLYNGARVGIGDPASQSQVIIYPNPATRQVNVRSNAGLAGSDFLITDQTGRTVLTGKLNSTCTTIPLGNLSSGIYMISAGEKVRMKFSIIKD